ncbi:MAG: hypothetical protein V7L29_29675 [Nostoc sp.]|uniref:hypothetical protein n=1 Tax=Nostoc sp. TaxID=1180 RepID=UPI002FF09191
MKTAVRLKLFVKVNFFNVDAERLAAGYRLRAASRREGCKGEAALLQGVSTPVASPVVAAARSLLPCKGTSRQSRTPVAHGGNPHRLWRLPLGEDRAGSP